MPKRKAAAGRPRVNVRPILALSQRPEHGKWRQKNRFLLPARCLLRCRAAARAIVDANIVGWVHRAGYVLADCRADCFQLSRHIDDAELTQWIRASWILGSE